MTYLTAYSVVIQNHFPLFVEERSTFFDIQTRELNELRVCEHPVAVIAAYLSA